MTSMPSALPLLTAPSIHSMPSGGCRRTAAGLSSVASHFEAEPDLLEAVRTLMGR